MDEVQMDRMIHMDPAALRAELEALSMAELQEIAVAVLTRLANKL